MRSINYGQVYLRQSLRFSLFFIPIRLQPNNATNLTNFLCIKHMKYTIRGCYVTFLVIILCSIIFFQITFQDYILISNLFNYLIVFTTYIMYKLLLEGSGGHWPNKSAVQLNRHETFEIAIFKWLGNVP